MALRSKRVSLLTAKPLTLSLQGSEQAAGKAAEAWASGGRMPASKPHRDTLSAEAEHAASKALVPPMPQREEQGECQLSALHVAQRAVSPWLNP